MSAPYPNPVYLFSGATFFGPSVSPIVDAGDATLVGAPPVLLIGVTGSNGADSATIKVFGSHSGANFTGAASGEWVDFTNGGIQIFTGGSMALDLVVGVRFWAASLPAISGNDTSITASVGTVPTHSGGLAQIHLKTVVSVGAV